MTSRLFGVVVAVILWLPTAVYALEAAELFERLAQNPATELSFVERSQHRLADEPVRFKGLLRMDATTGVFEKQVTAPSSMLFRIDRQNVSVTRKGRTFTQTLAERPELAGVVTVLQALMRGAPGELNESFDTLVDGNLESWKLTLSPRIRSISKRMTNIVVSGSNSRIGQIDTNWENGDWQEMILLP